MKCTTCRQEYSTRCDYNQGRCPHREPMINTHSLRFYNLILSIKNVFNRNKKQD
jgi:hypothetical protein